MEDYKNTSLSVDRRVADLVSRMTTEEKIYQTFYTAPAIPRLGVPAHNWWNEALHGVARAGVATIFPQAIGMAASFDDELLFKVATAISDEARAKHHENARHGERGIYFGLSYWSPNVNIFRDPRWGRGQETFGEDPYLTSRLGVAFCKGLQGDDAKFYKVIATPKHFAVHSGPESLRHGFDARVNQKDLYETYLPAFKACITEAKAYSIMGAYNRTNGEACCASPTLIQKILRGEWGFEGYMVSDCGAIEDIHEQHHVTKTAAESAALAIKTGCDLNCGKVYEALVEAVRTGLLSDEELTTSVTRLMKARFLMGQFDPAEDCKYSAIPYDVVASPAHKALSRQMARESIVLMKNNGILPLKHRKATRYAVIGPNAYDRIALEANYYGESNEYITPLEGLRRYLGEDAILRYAKGVERNRVEESYWGALSDRFIAEAEAVAERSDVILLFLGLSREEEGEQTGNAESDGGDDRSNLKLPGAQELLVERLSRLGKPIVLTLIAGSPMDLSKVGANVDALVNAWYPGEQGGLAIAETLFGANNPAGRLPVSYPVSTEDLPPFTDYSMRGRTYRYSEKPMEYPFGFGLSYSKYRYFGLRQVSLDDRELTFEVKVKNEGRLRGDEVVQVYRQRENSPDGMQRQLLAFRRVSLRGGGKQVVRISIPRDILTDVLEDGSRASFSGAVVFSVGGHQDDDVSRRLAGYAAERITVLL